MMPMGVVGVVAEALLMKQEICPWRCLRRGSCESRVLKMTGCSPTTPCQPQATNHTMTDTNPRDLIQRLTEKLDHLHCQYNVPNQSALIAEARALESIPDPS